jgi:hypothetical protein
METSSPRAGTLRNKLIIRLVYCEHPISGARPRELYLNEEIDKWGASRQHLGKFVQTTTTFGFHDSGFAARIGNVDRFQGQDAHVCILSPCSSYDEYGSRGLSFIVDRNRINVAISRAQCLAVVVADPRVASGAAGSMSEMNLVNPFCKLSDL